MHFAFPHLYARVNLIYARVNLKVAPCRFLKYNNDESFIYNEFANTLSN